MLNRLWQGAVLWVLLTSGASAQTAATYADRARLATASTFVGRVTIAAMVGAVAVITEDAATPDHTTRLRLASFVLRDPALAAQRLTIVLAATVPAQTTLDVVDTTLTDAQLQAVVATRWTVIAQTLTGGAQ